MSADRLFLIWSIEHDAWWAPNRIGYTRELHEAGRYPEAEARAIVKQANVVAFNEAAIPAACVEDARAKFADALAKLLRDSEERAARAEALLRAKPAEATDASLWIADREALRAITAAAGGPELLGRIGEYYHDADRAARTPRAFLYLHLGMAIGEALRARSEVR